MSGPDDAALQKLASRIPLLRPDFERVFDEVSAGRALPFKVVALMSPDALPFLEPLKSAREEGFFKDLAGRLAMMGAFDALDDTPEEAPLTLELQGIVDSRLGMSDTERLHQGTVNARKRVCRVTIGTDPPVHGTGFLIGPQAVLTARHVVAQLLDADGNEQAGSHKIISVHFDEVGQYHRSTTCNVTEQWLIATSPGHALEAPDAPLSDFDQADPEEFRDCLDYAVLRLDKVTGRERGYYKLDAAREPRTGAVNSAINLHQHPGGDTMHTAPGRGVALWPDTVRTRFRHTAGSIPGSSGGLILDHTFEPVAMHQCTFRDADGNSVINGAIPTACIAARRDQVEDIVGPDPIWRVAATGQPIVGRDNFQTGVDRALAGTIRLIAVRGAPDSGKSFSTTILRSMLDESSHVIASVSAEGLPLDAVRLAELLIKQLPQAADAAPLPEPDAGDTALEAWIRDYMLPALIEALRRAAGNRMLWLVIDQLDTHPIGSGTAASLLERLYSELGAYPFLRVILIGQRTAPPGAQHAQLFFDDVNPVGIDEIKDYLARRFTQAGKVKTMEEIAERAEMLLNLANASSRPLVQAVTEQIVNSLGPDTFGVHQ